MNNLLTITSCINEMTDFITNLNTFSTANGKLNIKVHDIAMKSIKTRDCMKEEIAKVDKKSLPLTILWFISQRNKAGNQFNDEATNKTGEDRRRLKCYCICSTAQMALHNLFYIVFIG